ncbi:hypothetical protein QAD02_022793, partial [Eretmocerus hayati]
QCSAAYYGKLLGKLSQFHHGVSGEVYAVDARTLFIKDFTYDGEGPAAWFYGGTDKTVGRNGFKIPDEQGTLNVLKRYRKKDITLTLPEGQTLNKIKWFSVYCDEFAVNFGDVKIPRNFDYPRPQKLQGLSGIHGVSSEPVVVVDAQTLLVPGFTYDGEAPDAKFWVGSGPNPSPQGIRVPDENGKEQPLRRYDRKTIVLTLPNDLTVHQLGHFGVWCEAFTVDFGHVQIPTSLNVPPSLKMLGVSPQSKLNCEVLSDDSAFEVRWAVAGDSIVVQLVRKLDDNQYMSFGLSADQKRSIMVGGDVVVAWVDKQTLQGYAVDYFLDAKSQCSGGRGSCPDLKIQDNTNSVRLLNAAMVNGYSIVTYQRPLKASDELDQPILTNASQAIIWGVGPLNDKGEAPPTTRRPSRIQATPAAAPKHDPWKIPPIECYEPEDGVLYAQMGPTGGIHGYPAITGHVGWGTAWYINGLLIPEIHVVRGKQYTFVVEGGDDVNSPARYHPFYITDDPIGGYQHKSPEEKANITIFAGVARQRGVIRPTGVGRLCKWVHDAEAPEADEFTSFGGYQRTLTLVCDSGEPGIVQWVPDENTPDTVYYQCFTHRYLGWKIHVHDSCDKQKPAASEVHEVQVEPDNVDRLHQNPDLEPEASMSVSPSKNGTNSKVPTFKPLPEYKYPKLVTDQYIVNRRPSTVSMNQILNSPVQITYTMPMRMSNSAFPSSAPYAKVPQKKLKMKPAQLSPMMMLQKKLSQMASAAYLQAPSNQVPSTLTQYQGILGLGSQLPNPRPEVFYERKKAILQAPSISRAQTLKKPIHPHFLNRPQKPTKLAEPNGKYYQPKQKVKVLKAEIGDTIQNDGFTTEKAIKYPQQTTLKPARNTGFDPKSIVIEKGFKPILRMPTDDNDGEARSSNVHISVERSSETMQQDERAKETGSEQHNDSFGPVFIPSPPDSNLMKKAYKKKQFLQTKLKTYGHDNTHTQSSTNFDRRNLGIFSSSSDSDSVRHLESGDLRPHDYSQLESTHLSMDRTKREAQNTRQHRDSDQEHQNSHAEVDHHNHNYGSVQRLTDDTHQASTGEIILANIEYIVLTVVLYYAL